MVIEDRKAYIATLFSKDVTKTTQGRRKFLLAMGTAATTSVGGCLGLGTTAQTEGKIQRVILLGEFFADEGSQEELRNQRVLTLSPDGTDLSEYIAEEYDISEDDLGSDFLLRDLPLDELYHEFHQLVCETVVELSENDEINNTSAGEILAYNAYSELFDYMKINSEQRLWVGKPKNRHAINHPRIIDVE